MRGNPANVRDSCDIVITIVTSDSVVWGDVVNLLRAATLRPLTEKHFMGCMLDVQCGFFNSSEQSYPTSI
ncbi:hypothetical protein Bhyg_04452 [Pseudolycoriella hygida]|uniref:Uncharacterized protein n=1 Tax=Pseudolycoriella hygida TaxID=35572 RepID=A0A9Q0NFB3_9DIPT|nr:hypothetical protein Bhyg_04452 [Pseudolycoriella hygida]